ncbi:MAG: CpsD/CapB family tyrosine-protein kinase [Deltaproteobacteria bacterium]
MKENDGLITQINPKSYVSEAYRALRTNIQFYNFKNQYKTILITSSGVREGKSTVISNLAVSMAQSGSKVLLLDGDFRRPAIYKLFNLNNNKGLSNMLVSEHQNYRIYIQNTKINNLNIITSGPIPPNPSEILGSQAMKDFLEVIKNEYDIILIDSPPIDTMTDAAVLSIIVDGVILLINSGKVRIDAAKRAKESLQRVNANIIGVVMNNVKVEHENYYYYNYYSTGNDLNKKRKRKPEKAKKI